MQPRLAITSILLVAALAIPAQAATYYELADSLVAGPTAQPTGLALSANGQNLYLAGDAGGHTAALTLLRFQGGAWQEGQVLFQAGDMTFDDVVHLQLAADGRFLYVAAEGRVVVLTVAANGSLTVLEQHDDLYTGDPLALLQGDDPTWLYVGTADGIVSLRADVTTGRLSSPETVEGPGFVDFSRSRDGQYLIGVGDPVVRLYSVRNGLPLRVSSLDDFLVETDVMTNGLTVTSTRDSAEFYVLGRTTSALPTVPDTQLLAILRIVEDDQLNVVGQDDLDLTVGVSVADLALSADGEHLLVSYDDSNDHSDSLATFALDPNGFVGNAGINTLDVRAGDSLGPATPLLATQNGQFLVGGFGGFPVARITIGDDESLAAAGLLDRTVAPLALAVFEDQFFVGNGTSMFVMGGVRQGFGLVDVPMSLDGGFGIEVTDMAISADGSLVATLTRNAAGTELQFYSRGDDDLVFQGSTLFNARHAGLAFSPDGQYLYAGPDLAWRIDGTNLVPLAPIAPSTDERLEYSSRVRISPDGLWLFQTINTDEPFYGTRVFRRDPATGLLTEIEDSSIFDDTVDVVFSPNSQFVYVLRALPAVDRINLRLDVYHWNDDAQEWELVATHSEAGLHQNKPMPIGELVMDPGGRFLFFVGRNQGQVAVYDRNPGTGDVVFRENLALPAGSGGSHDGAISLAVGSTGELYVANERLGRLDLFRRKCVTGDARSLCVGVGNRFAVEIDWHTAIGEDGFAHRVEGAPASDSGIFYFFSEDNWEALVKVLDACHLNDRFWVFAATTTNVEYHLRVTDTLTGRAVNYHQAQGEVIPAITDTDALDVCGREGGGPAPLVATPAAASTDTMLDLGNFEVRLNWITATGQQGVGRVVPFQSADSGVFTFFSNNNWETLVKVLDGCDINDHYWLFAAAPTDVGFQLQVKNVQSGVTKTWNSPAGQPAPAIIDNTAFPCP